ncbi:MAG: hypothetical protein FWE80_07145 [Oscillospiraceae bacterium]|nr:hypothetical protein [Oscillospiraceae bacterium]
MSAKKVWLISLGAVLLASVYPIYMGISVLGAHLRNGGVEAADYPKYVIPYTPLCIALLCGVVLLPLVYKLCKKYTLPALSAFGVGLFLGIERFFERILVFETVTNIIESVESWQMYSCMAIIPPEIIEKIEYEEVTEILTNPLNLQYSPAFKLHFYLIAIIIILAVLGVVYGFYKMARTKDAARKKPLITQLIAVTVFIGLCVFACFTAFFRTGTLVVSPLSAALMAAFFAVFGITAGVYTGTWLHGKKRILSRGLPAAVAVLTTVAMYIGELILLDGTLYRFGTGFFFSPMGQIPFAPADILLILLAGAITLVVSG